MKFRFILWVFALFILASCGSKSQSDTNPTSIDCPPNKAWAVTKGDDKESVRQFMLEQQLDVTDEDSVLVGFGLNKVIWATTQWDMATVKFDANNKANAVQLMRGEPFDEFLSNDVVSFFEIIWGESKFDEDLQMWNFDVRNEAMVFFTLQPRPLLNVVWK